MSQQLIARSKDLLALWNDGFHLEIRGGYLLVKDVPYVNAAGLVRRDGVLVSRLELQVVDGQQATKKPNDHVARWIGEHPCHANGEKIRSFENGTPPHDLGSGLRVDHTFSAKANYRDYEHKVRAYLGWIVGEAQRLDPAVTAQTYPVYATDADDDSPFQYIDTASTRAHIGADNEKLAGQRIAIVGVGGTGAYVLDFVAKTCVKEIHLFDADRFDTHNAFRAPGAWSLEELQRKESKVDNFVRVYSKLRRRGLVGHNGSLTADNVHFLKDMDFVFLCLDAGKAKRAIVDSLVALGVAFVDVGMGITRTPTGLQGIVRLVTCSGRKRDHIDRRMSFGNEDEAENEYATNIQIAELNALNAALAVMRWKRLASFYRDAGHEHYTSYQIATGELINEDHV